MDKQTLYLYLRCSQDNQIKNSIPRQKEMGLRFFEEKKDEYGFKDYKIYEDGGQSRFWGMEKRQKMTELMDGIDMGFVKHIWIEDWSRLTGEIEDVIEVESKITLHRVSIYEGNYGNQKYKVNDEMKRMMTMMETFYQKKVKRGEITKSIESKKRLFLEGCYMKGDPPFGYKLVDRRLVVRRDESKWVKKIFDWYGNQKYSLSQIRQKLQMNNVKRRRSRSNVWNDINITTIFENENYIGKDYYTDHSKDLNRKKPDLYPFKNPSVWEKLTNECPSIVDEKIFNKVKKLRNKNKSRPTKREYFLHGKLRCECGCEWVGRWYHKYDKPFYHCQNNERRYFRNTPNREHLHKQNCDKPQRIDGLLLDKYVWNNFLTTIRKSKWIKEKVKNEILGEKYGTSKHRKKINSDKKRIQKEIKVFEKNKIQFIKDRFVQNLSSIDYEEIVTSIDSKIRQLESEFIEVQKKENLLDKRKEWIDWLGHHNEKIDEYEKVTDMKQKRRIIDFYIDKIQLGWNDVTKQHSISLHYKYPLVGGDMVRKGDKLNWDKWGNGYKLKKGEQMFSLSSSNFFLTKKNYQTSLNGYGIRFDSSVPFLKYIFHSKTHLLSSTNYNKPLSKEREKLHTEIFKLKDEGLGYRRIHKSLVESGFKIGKSPTSVDSIIKKRILRNTILEQGVTEDYQNFDIQFLMVK